MAANTRPKVDADGNGHAGDDSLAEYRRHRAQRERLRAEREALELAHARDGSIPRPVVAQWLENLARATATGLRLLPTRCAARLAMKDLETVRASLKEEVENGVRDVERLVMAFLEQSEPRKGRRRPRGNGVAE